MAHILIVDDDLVVSEAFGRILALAGYSVVNAHTAEAGLQAATHASAGAIILDMRVPIMGGLSFLRALREDPRGRAIPVAVLTGNHFLSDEVVQELKSLGASISYKPVRTNELAALAKSLFSPHAGS